MNLPRPPTPRLRQTLLLLGLACTPPGTAQAESRFLADFEEEPYRASSDFFQLANPIAALGVTIYQRDGQGALQLGYNLIASTVTTEALKRATNDTAWGERPDGRDHAFPSGHVAMTCSAAAFLHHRYGLAYGAALYASSAWTAYARVHNDDHHWRDVIAGCALSYGFSRWLTRPLLPPDVELTPAVSDAGALQLSLRWRF